VSNRWHGPREMCGQNAPPPFFNGCDMNSRKRNILILAVTSAIAIASTVPEIVVWRRAAQTASAWRAELVKNQLELSPSDIKAWLKDRDISFQTIVGNSPPSLITARKQLNDGGWFHDPIFIRLHLSFPSVAEGGNLAKASVFVTSATSLWWGVPAARPARWPSRILQLLPFGVAAFMMIRIFIRDARRSVRLHANECQPAATR